MTKLDTALLFSFQIFEKGRVGLCSSVFLVLIIWKDSLTFFLFLH